MERRMSLLSRCGRTVAVIATLVTCGEALLLTAAAERKPNVLFIAIDDLNDWVGCLGGHPDVKTPHLDRLAARGVLFTKAYCAAPACNPSRAALMTGIRPSTSGVYLNPQPWRQSPVLKTAVTIPQHFMAHGYRALGSGKIYHGDFYFYDVDTPAGMVEVKEENRPSIRQFEQGERVQASWNRLASTVVED